MHDVPENLLYSKDHEWIEIDGDIGTIGISDHAQAELSDDPYGAGWLYKIRLDVPTETEDMMNATDYEEYCS